MTNTTNSIARHWRLKAHRYRLMGQICPDCQKQIFPPREICPYCAPDHQQAWFQLPIPVGAAATLSLPLSEMAVGLVDYTAVLIERGGNHG